MPAEEHPRDPRRGHLIVSPSVSEPRRGPSPPPAVWAAEAARRQRAAEAARARAARPSAFMYALEGLAVIALLLGIFFVLVLLGVVAS